MRKASMWPAVVMACMRERFSDRHPGACYAYIQRFRPPWRFEEESVS